MANVITLVESERGCGFRKPRGKYLIGGSISSPCCLLPFPLDSCPCCGNEIKFTRGFQWITTKLFSASVPQSNECYSCKLNPFNECERIGLMWVGEKYYPTPGDFVREANRIGVSKRIGTIPKDCRPGTWVALAHPRAIATLDDTLHIKADEISQHILRSPGIFMLFKITSLDYVVSGEETEEELNQLEQEGFRLVKIEREGSQRELNL